MPEDGVAPARVVFLDSSSVCDLKAAEINCIPIDGEEKRLKTILGHEA